VLFDLRGKGRRRTVQIVYGGIAVIFLIGFIGFGVGSGLGGNFNISELFEKGGGNTNFGGQVAKAKKVTNREPNNPAAWAALVDAQLREAGGSEFSNQSETGFTAQGKKLLAQAQRSWERYLALERKNPNPDLAKRMVRVLGEEGLNQPAAAVEALQIPLAREPSSRTLNFELAQYAYEAGNTRQGDLAGAKTLALTAKSEQAHLKGVLNELKKNAGHTPGTTTAEGTEGG
jgi:hypothetical protein